MNQALLIEGNDSYCRLLTLTAGGEWLSGASVALDVCCVFIQADESKSSLDTAACNIRPFSSLITKLINCFHHLEQVSKQLPVGRLMLLLVVS